MKWYAIVALPFIALTTPALAAEHYAVIDTVGNCSVIDAKPSPYDISGLKILGERAGYPSPDAAAKVLKLDSTQCKGVIERG